MLKLIIAEDELFELESLCYLIRTYFAEEIEIIATYTDGEKALEGILKENPDMVFLDIHMPIKDGLSIASILHKQRPSIAIAMITAYSYFEYAQQAIRSGVKEYLLKPYSIKSLKTTVHTMIQLCTKEQMVLNEEDYLSHKEKCHLQELQRDLLQAMHSHDQERVHLLYNQLVFTFIKSNRQTLLKEYLLRLFLRLHEAYELFDQDGKLDYDDFAIKVSKLTVKELKTYFKEVLDISIGHKSMTNRGHIIQKVKYHIQMHYMDDIRLNQVANQFGLSPYYLSRCFKEEVGKNFKEYLVHVRLTEAEKLIMLGEKNVSETAYKVGFKDPNYFSSVFKKYYGVSPKKYNGNKFKIDSKKSSISER